MEKGAVTLVKDTVILLTQTSLVIKADHLLRPLVITQTLVVLNAGLIVLMVTVHMETNNQWLHVTNLKAREAEIEQPILLCPYFDFNLSGSLERTACAKNDP